MCAETCQGWLRERAVLLLMFVAWGGVVGFGCREDAPAAPVERQTPAADGGGALSVDASTLQPMAAGGRAPIVPADICDRITPALGSCDTNDACQESSDPAGWEIIQAICILPGDKLRTGLGCSTYRISGRCYSDNGGHPVFTFGYGGRSAAASFAQGCQANDERFCPNLAGASEADYRSCTAICAAHQPDLSRAPECALDFDCVDDCVHAGLGVSAACSDCIHDALSWPPSYCGERECQCTPPFFPKPSDPVCATRC